MKCVSQYRANLRKAFSGKLMKTMACCVSLSWTCATVAAETEDANPTVETPHHNASVISEQSNVDDFTLVVDVKIENALNQVNPALSAGGYIVADSIVYKMTVMEVVKGDKSFADNKLSLKIPLTACHRLLNKGQRYILQVDANDLDSAHVESCDNLASLPVNSVDETQKIAKGALQNTGS